MIFKSKVHTKQVHGCAVLWSLLFLLEMNQNSEVPSFCRPISAVKVFNVVGFFLFVCLFAGDYDGALSVFTEMQLMCQERGLQLPGTTTPVGQIQL